MGARKQFTPEFKREAVQLLEGGSRPASELARELGVRRNQLYKWQREFQARTIKRGRESFIDRSVSHSIEDGPCQAVRALLLEISPIMS
jgi:transposase